MCEKELYSKLEDAALEGNLCEVVNILSQNPNLNLNDKSRYCLRPPLHHAAAKGYYDLCKVLLEYGADIDYINDISSPLNYAAEEHLDIVKLLVEHGADLDNYENAISSALDTAARKGNLDIVRYLVEKGADINRLTTTTYFSPLDWSIIYEHEDVSQFLRGKGALSNIKHDYIWSEEGGGISQHIDRNIGRVVPNKFNEMECGVFNRIAEANRGKNSLLFSVGNFKYSSPYVEFIIVFPGYWNPYSNSPKTRFPYLIMTELTNQIRKGRRYSDGDFISNKEDGFNTLLWPEKLAGFYVVDYNFSNTEDHYADKDDIITLYTLIPVKSTKKGYSEQSLEKLKSKKWKAIELSL